MNSSLFATLGILFAGMAQSSLAGQSAQSMGLADCLETALRANHDLSALEHNAEASAARADNASRQRYPTLALQGGLESHVEPMRIGAITANGEMGSFSRDLWSAGIGVAVPLYTGGQINALQQATDLLASAAESETQAFRERLSVAVAEGFHNLLAMESLLRSLERSEEALKAQESRIESLMREQKAAEVDLLRIQVRLATLEQQRIEAGQQAMLLNQGLNVLMGRPSDVPWVPASTSEEQAMLSDAIHDNLEWSVGDRSDEVAAGHRRDALEATVTAVAADHRPRVQLEAAWSARGDWYAEDDYDDAVVGLTVRWNLWDAGRTRSRIAEARADVRAQEARLTAIRERRALEFQQSLTSLSAAEKRVRVARLSVGSALEALRIEQQKYDAGKGLISDVLGSEAAALEAESLLARAEADRLNALARCDFARGVLFTQEAWLPAFRQILSTDVSQ